MSKQKPDAFSVLKKKGAVADEEFQKRIEGEYKTARFLEWLFAAFIQLFLH